MGIVCELKQISAPTLEVLKQSSSQVSSFFSARYSTPEEELMDDQNPFLPSILEARLRSSEGQFIDEWKVPALSLHKYWVELSFLLAGYIPGSDWTIPELRSLATQAKKDFLPFLVIENSQWDGLPLVNVIGAGTKFGYSTSYAPVQYLKPDEVEQLLHGLIKLSKNGFQERYRRESQQEQNCSWIDWSEKRMLKWLTDYYKDIVDYYKSAVANHRAMLLYFN